MTKRAILILAAVLLLPAPLGGGDPKLPPLDGYWRCGCNLAPTVLAVNPDGTQATAIELTVWIDFRPRRRPRASHDWRYAFSFRASHGKSLQDCADFIRQVGKALEKREKRRR